MVVLVKEAGQVLFHRHLLLQVRLYQEKMAAVEQKCIQELQELFLERTELFALTESTEVIQRVHEELKVGGVVNDHVTG